jgi:hypothetical protein
MHGLINRSIQCFIRDTYGEGCWEGINSALGLGPDGFETMFSYEDGLTESLLARVAVALDKPEDIVLEDVGTYLVSHSSCEPIRRLLRFGGESFAEFLHSLDDLPDRARLAIADLALPELELIDEPDGRFMLHVTSKHSGFAYVLVGVLRAMADDYGALALLDLRPIGENCMAIEISLLDSTFAEGRSFSLAGPSAYSVGAAE